MPRTEDATPCRANLNVPKWLQNISNTSNVYYMYVYVGGRRRVVAYTTDQTTVR